MMAAAAVVAVPSRAETKKQKNHEMPTTAIRRRSLPPTLAGSGAAAALAAWSLVAAAIMAIMARATSGFTGGSRISSVSVRRLMAGSSPLAGRAGRTVSKLVTTTARRVGRAADPARTAALRRGMSLRAGAEQELAGLQENATAVLDDGESGGGAATAAAPPPAPLPPDRKSRRRPAPPPVPPLLQPGDFPSWAYGPRDFFSFEVVHESRRPGSSARAGVLRTPHGTVETPAYVAVATNAALKSLDWRQAAGEGQQIAFCNTYHLLVHPGADLVGEAGGLHRWTGHDGPLMTDSGGFQVFSLAHGSVHEDLTSRGELKARAGERNKKNRGASAPGSGGSGAKPAVSEEGVAFRSYRDGSRLLLTPESTIQAQKKLGADIIIPLDELPGYYTSRADLEASLERTHRWEARSLAEHLRRVQGQAMYSVIHGGVDRELRTRSVDYLASLPFDGHAIGGSLGNGRAELRDLLDFVVPQLDSSADRRSKPRHLLGIADEESVRNAVSRGLDTMDSCYPTRLARHGTLLTRSGEGGAGGGSGSGAGAGTTIKIGSGRYRRQFGVRIDEGCGCSTCARYDRSYLWHLFKAREPLAMTLATVHNVHYMNRLMRELREQILRDEV